MKRMFLMSVCVLCMAQVTGEHEDWPQYGCNSQHTFYSDTVLPHQLEIVWQYHVEPKSLHHSRERFCPLSCPAVIEDRVYILDFSTLYCLSLHTGRLLYDVPAYSIYPYTPAVGDGYVYTVSERNLFRCSDARTGTTVWERELLNLHTVSPVVDDDTVYVTADHSSSFHRDVSPCGWMVTEWSTLVAMDRKTGEEIWRYSVVDLLTAGRGIGFPVVADDNIFFYVKCYKEIEYWDEDPEKSGLVCLNARTGTFKWIGEGVLASSPTEVGDLSPVWMAYYEDKIYFCVNGYTLCLDIKTLNPLWEYTAEGWSPLSIGNGVVVVNGWTQVSCLDAETGKELWVLPSGSSGSVMTRNDVFFGWGENLYRVNIESGEIIASYNLGGSVFLPVAAQGCILVGTSENRIYCLGQSGKYRIICALAALGGVIVVLVFMRKGRSRT